MLPFEFKTIPELEIAMLEPESSSMEFCSWNPVHGIRIEKQDWNQDWNQDWGSRLDPNSLDFDLKLILTHLLTFIWLSSICDSICDSTRVEMSSNE